MGHLNSFSDPGEGNLTAENKKNQMPGGDVDVTNWYDVWINISFKFDKLCRATRLWRDVDSNVALNLCQTQTIHYDNVIIPAKFSDFTLIRRLNQCYLARLNSIQSTVVLQSSLSTIKFDTTIAGRFNWRSTETSACEQRFFFPWPGKSPKWTL